MIIAEWLVFGVLLVFSAADLKWKKVWTLPVVILSVLALVYRIWFGTTVFELLFGLVPGGIMILLSYATRESIGIGDGLVLGALGLFCGIKKTVAVLGMALVLVAMLAVILLIMRKAGRKTELPFLPFLCAGYLLCIVW